MPKMDLPRKNKAHTKRRILRTVERLLVDEGFSALGINRIANEAGVAKVLIYRYFGDLEGLLDQFVKSEDFWPVREEIIDLPREAFFALDLRSRIKRIMFNFITALGKRPQTMAILAWEMSGNPALTRVMEDALGQFSQQISETLAEDELPAHPQLKAMLAVLSAGLVHLGMAYQHHQRFSSLRLETPEDWKQVMKALSTILDHLPIDPPE